MTDGKIKLRATKLPDQITSICCIVCSRVSERPLIAAEGEGIVICPYCLAEGDIDAKLEHRAAKLEERARWLRTLVRRLEVPSPAELKEFIRPEENDLFDDPPATRLQIKSRAQVDREPADALIAARVKARAYSYDVTLAHGTLCPQCSKRLRATAVHYIDESGFAILCESCHLDIIRAKQR